MINIYLCYLVDYTSFCMHFYEVVNTYFEFSIIWDYGSKHLRVHCVKVKLVGTVLGCLFSTIMTLAFLLFKDNLFFLQYICNLFVHFYKPLLVSDIRIKSSTQKWRSSMFEILAGWHKSLSKNVANIIYRRIKKNWT